VLRALSAHAQRWGLPAPETAEALAHVARLLGLEAREESGERTRPWRERGAEKLHRALGAMLAAEARRRPLLLVLEDAHVADAGTAGFAAAMARELAGTPAAVLVVGRELPAPIEAGTLDFTMKLEPLGEEEARLLLRAILTRLPDAPDALLAMTLERARGNPFAIEEVVRLLIETGAIQADAERWSVDGARLARAASDLPKALEDLVRIRVASLSTEEGEVLRKAAVCGELFTDGAIAMIELLEGWKLEDFDLFGDEERRRLEGVLAGLVRKDLILPRGDAPTGGGDKEYAF
jgi:predicted ATPase